MELIIVVSGLERAARKCNYRQKGVIIRQKGVNVVYKISSAYARILLRHLHHAGFDPQLVLEGIATNQEVLETSDEIDLDCFRAILEKAEQLQPVPPPGFVIGAYNNTLAMGPLGVSIGSAPNLRAGLRCMEQFTRLHASYIVAALNNGLNGIELSFDIQGLEGPALRHHVEATLMLLEWYVQMMTGKPPSGTVAQVCYARPAYSDQYAEHLRSSVEFNSHKNALVIPHEGLDSPSPYYSKELWEQSQKQLSKKLLSPQQNNENLFQTHLRAFLASHSPPLPRLPEVARQLHLSERTLNRRLQQEGSSFRVLRNEIADSWAQKYLRETTASIESIAFKMGYEDAANFRRAFRKIHGITPSQFRATATAALIS